MTAVDVEIKVNFTGSQIEQAKQVFDLKPDDADKRDIWFGEIRTGRDGRAALPLLGPRGDPAGPRRRRSRAT